ncbi:MAG: hypothetical protein SFU99_08930 [Saprospiraceae bacterium]|nr:hypothetical protein [Saprospiraceae bacterium]
MKRRDFIQLTPSAIALTMLNAHHLFAASNIFTPQKSVKPRIKALRLLTSSPLSEMKRFYGDLIGLPIVDEKAKELTIQTGLSQLTFVKINEPGVRPFYHFAFNIPQNKIEAALKWQQAKTPLVNPRPGMPGDPSKDIVHFPHWNAHSIFFLDPAGNLVEYIARHDLKNDAPGAFSVKDILYASEIGLILNDVQSIRALIEDQFKLTSYRGSGNFMPMGDEYGLLLLLETGTTWTSHPGQVNKTYIFGTSVYIYSDTGKNWKSKDYPYEIITK